MVIRSTLLLALSLVVSVGAGAPRLGHAAPIDPAIDRADGAFLDGDYQRALEGYLQLYARTREPNYLHNIASCYQKLGLLGQAIQYFTRYLEVGKDVGADTRADVRRTIEHLRAAVVEGRGDATAAPPPPSVSPAPVAPPPMAMPTPMPMPTPPGSGYRPSGPPPLLETSPALASATATSATQPPAQDGRSIQSVLRGAAIVEAGVGVAALGMGIYFGMRANSLERQVADGKVFDAYADRDGQRAHAYQYGMFTIGGALLAGSAAFFYCSTLADRVPSRIAILPAAGANGAGGTLAARF